MGNSGAVASACSNTRREIGMVAYLESYCDSALYNHLYIDNKLSGINIWKQNEILRASERVGEMAIVGTRGGASRRGRRDTRETD